MATLAELLRQLHDYASDSDRAAQALAELGDPAVIPELMRALRRDAGWENGSGAQAKALAIARLGGEAALTALSGELIKLEQVDLSDDAGDIADEVGRARAALVAGLSALGPMAVPRLLELLRHPGRGVHCAAARALGPIGDARALEPLLERARRTGPRAFDERLSALQALGELHHPGALDTLVAALAPSQALNAGWIRRIAALALGRLGDPAGCAPLCSQLSDSDWFTRLGACEGLALLRDPRSRPALEQAALDADTRVAKAARAALAAL